MRYFIIYAHPEPRSLNGSLKDAAVLALTQAGHEVRVSDLYAMGFKAVADADDFQMRESGARLVYHRESEQAYRAGQLQPEVALEIDKLLWAEVVVLQFPLWWFGPPAILKGWFDRVLVNGFAIGVPKQGTRQWLRYGEGVLEGRRGLVAVTTGGREAQFSGRGVNGPIFKSQDEIDEEDNERKRIREENFYEMKNMPRSFDRIKGLPGKSYISTHQSPQIHSSYDITKTIKGVE